MTVTAMKLKAEPDFAGKSLQINTFSNNAAGGGQNALFKALGHPLAAEKARALAAILAAEKIPVYDPYGQFSTFAALYGKTGGDIYVQRVEERAEPRPGKKTRMVGELASSKSEKLFIAAFGHKRILPQIRHLTDAEIISFDDLRIPEEMLSVPGEYLSPFNFATNFALFRDADGEHTRITFVNYWSRGGTRRPAIHLMLLDAEGKTLAGWKMELENPEGAYTIDSAEVKKRFGLPDFCGSLFMHAVGDAGHDIMKYVLDFYGDDETSLSCTHDANSWPADFYAGMPAPREGEKVLLWVQNSHPAPVPPGSIGMAEMGTDDFSFYPREIAPFATVALDVAELLPQAEWPGQIEIFAGKYFVRPRYEVIAEKSFMAHANVERTDLRPDPELPRLSEWIGKGHLLCLPILPRDEFETAFFPTPMARGQNSLPLKASVYGSDGKKYAEKFLGDIPRAETVFTEMEKWLGAEAPALSGGHVELAYDFREGGGGDGWIHAIGRFTQKKSGHAAETSFGSHIFNIPAVYKNEPQSYTGRPPGLTTRIALRLSSVADSFCHLIYPCSLDWHDFSDTSVILHNAKGAAVAERQIRIPKNGSYFFKYRELFGDKERNGAEGGYVIIRDATCRLFGYQGMTRGDKSFCMDHMFGF